MIPRKLPPFVSTWGSVAATVRAQNALAWIAATVAGTISIVAVGVLMTSFLFSDITLSGIQVIPIAILLFLFASLVSVAPGLILSSAQAAILRRSLPLFSTRRWIITTTGGAFASEVLLFVFLSFFLSYTFIIEPGIGLLLTITLFAATASIFLGAAQALVLARYLNSFSKPIWITATAGGVAAGIISTYVIFEVASNIDLFQGIDLPPSLFLWLSIAAGSAIMGSFQALFFQRQLLSLPKVESNLRITILVFLIIASIAICILTLGSSYIASHHTASD